MDVFPKGDAELEMIKNTLPSEARDYVKLDEHGKIDESLLDNYTGESNNFQSLRELVHSKIVTTVSISESFMFSSPQGEIAEKQMSYLPPDELMVDSSIELVSGLTTGEGGFYGKTLFPDREGYQNSTTSNIEVYIHPFLSTIGRAEAFSHEGYGHALLYIRNGFDHNGASHQFVGTKEANTTLKTMILQARRETIYNLK